MRLKNYSVAGLVLLSSIALSGCVTSSPEQLLSPTGTAQPLGQPKITGDFGSVNNQPQPATEQLSQSEVARAKAELTQDAAPSAAQAAQNNQATYQREVAELQKLAADQKKRRLREIESRNF
jgi:hypothetical protein